MNKLTQSNSQLLPSLLSVALTLIGTSSFAQNVGVDIASPQQKLDVAGGLRIGNTTNGLAGSIRWTGTQFEGHDGTTWIPLGSAADNDWIISGVNQYSGVAGNVGIGTTTPSDKLDVLGTIRATNPGTSPNGSDIRLGSPANDVGVTMNRGNGSGSSQQRWDIKITNDNALRFRSQNTTDYFAFTNSGNMGIGTNTPADKLHVVGSIRMVDGNQAAGRVLVSDANGTMIWTNLATSSNTYMDEIRDADNDTKIQVEESADEDIIRFDAQGSQLYAMRKMAGGTPWIEVNSSNTLIGNSISTAINGSGVYNTAMGYQSAQSLTTGQKNTYFGDNAGGFNTTGNWNTMIGTVAGQFNNGGNANTMVGANAGRNNLTGSGNVFLGNGAGENETTSNKLYIDNSSTATPLLYGDFGSNLLRVNGTLNVNNAYDMPAVAGTNGFVLQTNGAGAATWVNPNTIGADVTTASNGLTETGNDIQLGGPLTANTTITQDNAEVLTIANNGTGNTVINLQSTGDFDVQDNGTSAFMVRDDGNVGIGTNAPSEKLDVWGNLDLSAVQPVLKFSATGTPRTTNLTATFSPTSTAAQTLRVNLSDNTNAGTTEVMRFQGDGNIGIGVTSPTARLDIMGIGEDATSTALRLRSGNAGLGILSNQIVFGHNGLPNQQHAIKTRHHSALHERNAIDFYVWQPGDAANVGTKRVMTIDGKDNGMVGIGVLQPLDELHVVGSIRMIDGNQSAGRVLVSDANGTGTWTAPTSLSITEDQALTMTNHTLSISEGNSVTVVAKSLTDADSDTKVQVEESADEDVIRFDMAGIEHFVMNEGRLAVLNTGASIFIGQNAGINDDWSNNNNIGIGQNALEDNIIGGGNTAIGTNTLSNSNTSDNVAIGENTLTALTTGQGNTAVGKGGFQTNSTGSFNTSLGLYAGYFNQGSSNVFIGHRAGQDEAGSNKLYIDNTNTASPLIYGDFGTNELTVNGELGIGTTAPAEELHVVGNIRMVDGNQASGYVPVSDANGTMTWTDPTSLTITETDPQVSSSTSNYVPKWNGTTLTDGAIYDNGNVGIGTTAPSHPLHVRNVNGYVQRLESSATTGTRLTMENTSAGGLPWQVISTGSGNSEGTGNFLIMDGTTVRMALMSADGNVGIGTVTPGSKLHVVGNIRMVDGAEAAGRVLVSDANGTGTWTAPTSLSITEDQALTMTNHTLSISEGNSVTVVAKSLTDADNDTKVQVEESADEDIIRFDMAGTEHFTMTRGRLSVLNTGASVFIGQDAGVNDDWTNNNNIGIGINALNDNVTGGGNTAIGSNTLSNSSTSDNVAIGENTLTALTTGQGNTAVGKGGFQTNSTGSFNTSLGLYAGYFNQGSSNVFLGHRAGQDEAGSDKLYIDNTNTATPLIYGDFSTDVLRINGTLNVNNAYNMPTVAGTNGFVLQTNGAGVASWVNANTLTVTETDPQVSSATTNQIPKWNGTTLTDGIITDNGTNVGIGITAPGAKLDVAGTLRGTDVTAIGTNGNIMMANSNTSGTTPFRIDGNADKLYVIAENGTDGSATGTEIRFRTATSNSAAGDRMTINNQGNVGIGTAAPGEIMHVVRNTSDAIVKIESPGSFYDARLVFQKNGANTATVGFFPGTAELRLRTGQADGILFEPNGVERMRVNFDGNVGIATILPQEKLHVVGKIRMVDGNQAAGKVLVSDANGSATWTAATALTVTETDPQVSSATTNYVPKWNGTTLTDGAIFDNGSVGIGTASPASNLEVQGATNGSAVITIDQQGTDQYTGVNIQRDATEQWFVGMNNVDDDFIIRGDAATDFVTINNSDGNVGLGIAVPVYDLDIHKTEVAVNQRIYSNDAAGIGQMLVGANGGGHVNLVANSSAATYLGIPVGVSGVVTNHSDMVLATGTGGTATEKVRITTAGNLGIGSTAPGARLEVITDGTAGTGTLISQFGSTAAAGRIRFYDESATVGPSINFNAGNVAQITGAGNIALSPTGNVGVGTTTPTQAKLVVNGSQNTTLSYGYLNSGGNTGTSTNQTVPFSIYASARIAATEFNAYSDQRIKSIKGITDGATDLNTLMGIEVTDYTFIDKVEKGNGVQKKVIAQQVEQVYPQAVATITDVVPDIYKLADIRDGRIAIENTLKAGEKVRLVLADRTELAEVMAADADGFSVALKDNGQVFVFGREVSDFRTVDYEALSMLNLSATQELVRMINGLKRENEAMKADFSSLSSDVEMLKAMLNAGSTAGK